MKKNNFAVIARSEVCDEATSVHGLLGFAEKAILYKLRLLRHDRLPFRHAFPAMTVYLTFL